MLVIVVASRDGNSVRLAEVAAANNGGRPGNDNERRSAKLVIADNSGRPAVMACAYNSGRPAEVAGNGNGV